MIRIYEKTMDAYIAVRLIMRYSQQDHQELQDSQTPSKLADIPNKNQRTQATPKTKNK
jgi:hypothetical protein